MSSFAMQLRELIFWALTKVQPKLLSDQSFENKLVINLGILVLNKKTLGVLKWLGLSRFTAHYNTAQKGFCKLFKILPNRHNEIHKINN